MRCWITASVVVASLFLGAMPAAAQSDEVAEATAESAPDRPAARILNMAWLEGEWRGTGIEGNPAGESFSFAGKNQMVGHFWQLDKIGDVDFYELITITSDGESLTMRLKHFTADLTGWEEKEGEAALEFPLMSRSEDEWVFGPVTFTRKGTDRLHVAVKIRLEDGSSSRFEFDYQRVPSR